MSHCKKYFLVLLVFYVSFYCSTKALAFSISTNSNLSVTAVVVSPNANSGGGGGGGGNNDQIPTTVNFSGLAHPFSRIVILQDSIIVVKTIADPAAKFQASLKNISAGTHIFSVYAEDKDGRKSLAYTFPLTLSANTAVTISGIFLSPTIDIDKKEVKLGDSVIIFGNSIPNAQISILIHSENEHSGQSKSDASGKYSYTFNTTPLERGKHTAKSATFFDESMSSYSNEVSFIVGDTTVKNSADCSLLRGDLNCDKKVNLVDFSIMAYWYKLQSPPAKVDLNRDGKISLIDFSILAYNWTG